MDISSVLSMIPESSLIAMVNKGIDSIPNNNILSIIKVNGKMYVIRKEYENSSDLTDDLPNMLESIGSPEIHPIDRDVIKAFVQKIKNK